LHASITIHKPWLWLDFLHDLVYVVSLFSFWRGRQVDKSTTESCSIALRSPVALLFGFFRLIVLHTRKRKICILRK
jgi:hypothetical protein